MKGRCESAPVAVPPSLKRRVFVHFFDNGLIVRMTIVTCDGFYPYCLVEWSEYFSHWRHIGRTEEFNRWRSYCLGIICAEDGLDYRERYALCLKLIRPSADTLPMQPLPKAALC
jgi:hypothetical protein